MHDSMQQLLFSKKSAARMLDLSVRTLDYLLAKGDLESRRVGKKVLIPRAALLRFAGRNHTVSRDKEGQNRSVAQSEADDV